MRLRKYKDLQPGDQYDWSIFNTCDDFTGRRYTRGMEDADGTVWTPNENAEAWVGKFANEQTEAKESMDTFDLSEYRETMAAVTDDYIPAATKDGSFPPDDSFWDEEPTTPDLVRLAWLPTVAEAQLSRLIEQHHELGLAYNRLYTEYQEARQALADISEMIAHALRPR